jgi:predicted TIM-barrel fold metal-dependent hydrolase
MGAVMDLSGEDRVLWGSDFPHVDSNLEAPHLIRGSTSNLSPSRQRKLLGEKRAKRLPGVGHRWYSKRKPLIDGRVL